MHWIALPLPWCDEAPASAGTGVDKNARALNAAAGWWALRFTPRVALADGEAVLLEVSTTERLWGGREVLHALVLKAWTDVSARYAADTAVNTPTSAPVSTPASTPISTPNSPPISAPASASATASASGAEKPAHACESAAAPPPGALVAPPVWGTGPTALVAQAWLRMARAGRPCPPQGGVENLPLHTLTALRPHVASLERMGCRT